MDITAIFKSCLEALRQNNKDLSFVMDNKNTNATTTTTVGKPKIFPGKKSENYSKARELSTTITSLRDYLYENRNAYLNITAASTPQQQGHHHHNSSVFAASTASSGGKKGRMIIPSMSDIDRDLLDNDVQKIIHNCQKRILDYERLIENTDCIKNNPHVRTHMESISESLTAYLKQVTTVFSEMRAIRVKRTVDYQNMSRLSSVSQMMTMNNNNINKNTNKPSSSESSSSSFSSRSKEHNNRTEESKESNKRKNSLLGSSQQELEELDGSTTSKKSATIPDYFLDDGDIPSEELQLLENENAALLNQLNSLAQEVDQIQSNVVQIAQLQEIFTEKVLQQEKDIDIIGNAVVGATENIKGGNEQIRQAIQKNADFRVWVLFFILVMSFSLLFLDWYND